MLRSVAAVLYLQFVLHVMLFQVLYIKYHQYFPQYVCSSQHGGFF